MRVVSPGSLPLIRTSRGFTATASASSPLASDTRSIFMGLSNTMALPAVTVNGVVADWPCSSAAYTAAGRPSTATNTRARMVMKGMRGILLLLRFDFELRFRFMSAVNNFHDEGLRLGRGGWFDLRR